jgi:alanyl-tRNA synthetase
VTERLYYTDAYRAEFEAAVVELADAGRRVYLDRTIFYPTSGGQPHDTGRLSDIPVTDVVDEGERIAHLLAAPLDATASISGRIDWPRRFDHMQQHTGQHLLSAVLVELFGYATVSVHFGPTHATIDLATPSLTPEQVAAAEDRANTVVAENRPVAVSFADAASATGLRKASTREGPLRIVAIEGVDRSACGGTHVRTTGEIGAVLLRKIERVRQTTRLEFLCGLRAVRQARADYGVVARLTSLASAGADELAAVFDRQRAELKQMETARRDLERQLAGHRARELHAATPPDADGIRRVVVRERGVPLESLRELGQAGGALPATVFIGVSSSVPGIVVAASEDTGFDAGAAIKAALAAAGGRGGGTRQLAQGTVPDAAGLDAAVTFVLQESRREAPSR